MIENTAYFYLGTYSTNLGHVDGKAEGITLWTVNTSTGELKMTGGPWPIANSSHMCLGKDRKFLYSISEVSEYQGNSDGYLTVFSLDPESKNLTELGRKSSYGPGPAYVSIDKTGRYLLLANYGAGNIIVYPISENGLLEDPASNIMHVGSSVDKSRQSEPHPHSIVTSPDNKYVYCADLGIDKIKAYAFDENIGVLSPREDLDAAVPAGGGPRHMVFDPSGRFAYLTLELTSELAAYKYKNGHLHEIGIYSMLPENFDGVSYSAEVRVSPDGRFVYASNRGHNSIAVFEINQEDGKLERIQITSTEGDFPRNFNIDPGGSVLVAGNQNSHDIITYVIDKNTGLLDKAGDLIKASSPVLFCFY
jgi:6-phosphogluconolactonase